MKIKFNGEGIFPKITFDRREVILPTVPLNIVSKCVIIYNLFLKTNDNTKIDSLLHWLNFENEFDILIRQ